MKTYRIEFADSAFMVVVYVVLLTMLSLTIIGIPWALSILPTLYRITEEKANSD